MRPFDRLRALPAETLASAARGDEAAIEEVVVASHDAVRHMLLRLVGPSPELDDLRQTTLLHVVRGLPSYRPRAAFSTWLSGVCMNVVRDSYRRSKVRAGTVSVSDTDALARPGALGDGAQALEAREKLQRCLRALARLSASQRTVLVLKTVYGHSIDEIAKLTGSLRSTVRLRLYYGRKAFFRAIADELPADELSADHGGLDDTSSLRPAGSTAQNAVTERAALDPEEVPR